MADVLHSGTSITGGHTAAVAAGAAGFMTGADKTKLDGIAAGAQVVNEANVRAAAAGFTASLAVNSQKITGLLTGAQGTTEAISAQYADRSKWDPKQAHIVFEDFSLSPAGAISTTVPTPGGFLASTSGAGSTCTVIHTNNGATICGQALLTPGTTTTGRSSIFCSATTTCSTASQTVIDCKVSIPVLSTGTDTFNTRVGRLSSVLGANPSGIYFSHDANTNANWIANCGSGGVTTSTNTTIPVVAGQEYHLVAVKVAGVDRVDFYVDGVFTVSISTNLPTAALSGLAGDSTKTAGTAGGKGLVNIDWIGDTYINVRAA